MRQETVMWLAAKPRSGLREDTMAMGNISFAYGICDTHSSPGRALWS